tara:strand:- start:2219 stop:2593 length:375 start_codon:yes stop_codon:yes gene_type:complete
MKRNLNNNVMSKIAGITKDKVELKSEVVEFAKINDVLIGATKGVNVFSKNIDIALQELKDAMLSLKVDKQDLTGDLNRLKKAVEFVESKSKELGANVNNIKGYTEAVKAIKTGDAKLKEVSKIK